MKTDFAMTLPVSLVCLIAATCFVEFQIVAQESKGPPLSAELIKRIERLPQERLVVQEKANQISGGLMKAWGEIHIVKHWKPLLVELIGRVEKLDGDQAAKRYEQVMEVQGFLTQAALVANKEGIQPSDAVEYVRPDRVATENLLAYYVREVMFADHWDLDEYLDWKQRWRAGGDAPAPSLEPIEEDGSRSLIGHWEADPESGMFALPLP